MTDKLDDQRKQREAREKKEREIRAKAERDKWVSSPIVHGIFGFGPKNPLW